MITQAFTTCCILLALLPSPDREKIEARVNDDILTTSELNRMLKPLYRQYEQSSRGEELALRMRKAEVDAIASWIEHRLILQEARKIEGFQLDRMEIDKRFEEARSRFTSREEFDRALSVEGLDEEEYRKNLEDQYRVRALTYQRINSLINISPENITAYYREHEDDYRDDKMVRISNLLIPIPEGAGKDEATRELAEKILGELQSGKDFSELVRKHSKGPRADQGGDLGYYKKGQMRPGLDEAAFLLEVGEPSGIIETELGYHIIKCTGKREAYQKPLEELWEEIDDKLYQEEYQSRYDEWIKRLKSRAYIIIED